MDLWQMEYLLFAEENEAVNEDKRFKLFADYLGSYKDPKRAMEEMKRTQSDDSSDQSSEISYVNTNYGKEEPPIVRLESEEQKQRFETDFDKAMKNTFGEGYKEARIVIPAKDGDPSSPLTTEEEDEIIVK